MVPLRNFAIGVKRHFGARSLIGVPNHHDPAWLRVRQRLHKNGIHGAEDRSVGADAQRQCEHGDGSEAWSFRQHANAKSEVLPESEQVTPPASCLEQTARTVPKITSLNLLKPNNLGGGHG